MFLRELARLLFHCSPTEIVILIVIVLILVIAVFGGNLAGHTLVSALPR